MNTPIKGLITLASSQMSVSFSKLPPEIRVMIWRATLPTERVVPLHFRPTERYGQPLPGGFYATAPIPLALQICKESRTEALKRYVTAFTGTYIDFHTDVVLLTNATRQNLNFLLNEYYTDALKLRFIAADCNDLSNFIELLVPTNKASAEELADDRLRTVRRYFAIDDITIERPWKKMKNPVLRLDRNLYPRDDMLYDWLSRVNTTGMSIERGVLLDEE